MLLNHFSQNVLKSVLQDALETFFQKMSLLDEVFFRQLCKMSSRFANPTFLRRLKGILQRCFQGVFYHCLENHLAKMSKNCLCEMSYIPLYEMSFRQLCKICSRFANPTSFRCLKDILLRCLECRHKTSLRCLFAGWVRTLQQWSKTKRCYLLLLSSRS